MRKSVLSLIAGTMVLSLPLSRASGEESPDQAPKTAAKPTSNVDQDVPEINLLDALRDKLVSADAEGIGDGRMRMSITNRTKRPLRVVLPPGIIAQGATGQFGGMGGIGGGMGGMGGGMGGMGGGMGGMGGGMGGMGGGMGGGMSGGMRGGMGGMMGRPQTLPPTMGMMMLARMIMYFCGDPSSWDQRSLRIGMMGGMGMGGMGGMGGGMGGMGGMMGGGMRSVPPTDLPSALLNPGQTRLLPTRLVSVSQPDPETGLSLPARGEKLQILGDIAEINNDVRVQKALKRLAAEKAATSVSQLVLWNLAAGLDWETIGEMSRGWANAFELTLARDFIERLDSPSSERIGRLLFQVDAKDPTSDSIINDVIKMMDGKMMLGLRTDVGRPSRPDRPTVACWVRLTAREALVQVVSSDATAHNWVPFGKFSLPLPLDHGTFDAPKFVDALAEGILNRLVRVQLSKPVKENGKLVYHLRIDNASPLILNGLAAVGITSKADEIPRVLSGISLPPRKSMTVSASAEVVKALSLKQGVKLVALDLSAL